MNESKRVHHIDVLKGIGIILVLLGHCLVFSKTFVGNAFTTKGGYLFAIIYAFHMPLFFFISGYLYKRKDGVKFLSGKVIALVLPLIIYGVLNKFIYCVLKLAGVERYYGKTTFGAFWFLITLFYIVCLYYVIETHNIKRIKSCIMREAMMIFIAMVFLIIGFIYARKIANQTNDPIATCLVGFFFYEIGHFYRLTESKINVGLKSVRIIYIILGILCIAVLSFLTVDKNTVSIDFNTSRYGEEQWFLINSLLGIIGTYGVAVAIKQCKLLEYFGKNSMIILMIHIPASKMFPIIFTHFGIPQRIMVVLTILCTLVISCVVVGLINRYIPVLAGKFKLQD